MIVLRIIGYVIFGLCFLLILTVIACRIYELIINLKDRKFRNNIFFPILYFAVMLLLPADHWWWDKLPSWFRLIYLLGIIAIFIVVREHWRPILKQIKRDLPK